MSQNSNVRTKVVAVERAHNWYQLALDEHNLTVEHCLAVMDAVRQAHVDGIKGDLLDELHDELDHAHSEFQFSSENLISMLTDAIKKPTKGTQLPIEFVAKCKNYEADL